MRSVFFARDKHELELNQEHPSSTETMFGAYLAPLNLQQADLTTLFPIRTAAFNWTQRY